MSESDDEATTEGVLALIAQRPRLELLGEDPAERIAALEALLVSIDENCDRGLREMSFGTARGWFRQIKQSIEAARR